MGFIKEFKEFALRGNVVDMAVGIVIGAAFGKIVSSLVADVIMPPIGLLLGGGNFSEIKWMLNDTVSMNIGIFLQTIIDFILIAFAIFLVIKAINRFNKKKEETPAAPPAPSKEETLLTEIRDILKNK